MYVLQCTNGLRRLWKMPALGETSGSGSWDSIENSLLCWKSRHWWPNSEFLKHLYASFCIEMSLTWDYSYVFQLQLQRNEVIALVNLLNRLSESVKMVHDMGPDVERLMEDQIAKVSAKPGRLRRIWDLAVSFWWVTQRTVQLLGIHGQSIKA